MNMKKINKPLSFNLIIIIVSICFIYFGWNLPTRSKLIPYLVASFLIVLTIIQSLFEIIPNFSGKEIGKITLFIHRPEMEHRKIKEVGNSAERNNENKRFLNILKWILLLSLGTYFFGFLVILPIFTFLFYCIECHYKRNKALAVTVVFWIIVYLVFEKFLAIELYRGLIILSM